MLDINAEYMRGGLRRWKEKKLIAIQRRNEERAQQQAFAEAQALLPEPQPISRWHPPGPRSEADREPAQPAQPMMLRGGRKSEPPALHRARIRSCAKRAPNLLPLNLKKRMRQEISCRILVSQTLQIV